MSPIQVAVTACLSCAFWVITPQSSIAARFDAKKDHQPADESLFEWSPLIQEIEELLVEFELLAGPADGRMTAETRQAIRTYQKQSKIPVDGVANEALLKHMNNIGRGESLKQRLLEARNEQIEEARTALTENPATRDLVNPRVASRTALPSGNGQKCLRAPTVDCLLREASGAIDSITRDDYRDWALRDVIRAQARAGRIADARASIRRLTDLRLILVSLRETAIALAESGHIDEASDLTATIPEQGNRARALLAIAKSETKATRAYDTLLDLLPRLEDRTAAVEIAAELAADQSDRGATDKAEAAIAAIDDLPNGAVPTDVQRISLGAIATAYARIGLSEKALQTLKRIGDTSRDQAALAEAAGLLAKRHKTGDALATADQLRAPQLHVLALTKIANAQLRLGDHDAARASLSRAQSARHDIKRPFAADTALARIAIAWSKFPDYPHAFDNVKAIKSPALKARTLWRFATNEAPATAAKDSTGIFSRATAATNHIESPFDRAATLARAAMEFAKKSQTKNARATFDMAVREARGIRNNWWRARIYSLLATALVAI